MSFSTKILSFQKEDITHALVDQEKAASDDEYNRQVDALEYVFNQVEANADCSVSLIQECHSRCCDVPAEDMGPRLSRGPGQFRNEDLTSGDIPDPRGTPAFSPNAMLEILECGAGGKFNFLKGSNFTLCHPRDNNGKYCTTIDSTSVDSVRGNKTKEAFLKDVCEKVKTYSYYRLSFSYPNPTDKMISPIIKDYMTMSMEMLVKELNENLSASKKPQQKIKIIFTFIQSCERLHPFRGANHRVFVLCVLNFLLLKYGIGYCPLKNRRIFRTLSIHEILAIAMKRIVLLENCRVEIEKDNAAKMNLFRSPGCFFKTTSATIGGAVAGGGMAYFYFHTITSIALVSSCAGGTILLLALLLAFSHHHNRDVIKPPSQPFPSHGLKPSR